MAKSKLEHEITARCHWRCVVLDEGHIIKNEKTDISRVVRKLHCATKLLLTGTPLQNDLGELWGLLNWLYPAAFPDKDPFKKAYDLGRRVVDADALQAAQKMLSRLMLRRMKADVAKGLPPKLETVVQCPLAPQQLFWSARRVRGRVAATPRRRRGYSEATGRGDAAAMTGIFRGDRSRRRRGDDGDIPRRRRGDEYSVETGDEVGIP